MKTSALVVALLLGVAFATPAHAYLDPASGSMLLQLLLGGVAGAAVIGKLYWQRILGFFGVRPRQRDDSSS